MEQLKKYFELFINNYDDIKQWKSVERTIHSNTELYANDTLFKFLFDKMQYFKYDTMINSIKCLISKLDPHIKYVLFFPTDYPFKIGSENLIVLECFLELSKLNITDIITENLSIDHISNLLIVDDSVCTGRNIEHIIKSFPSVDNFTVISFVSNSNTECRIIDTYSGQHNIYFYNNHKYETLLENITTWLSSGRPINNETKEKIYNYFKNIIGDTAPSFYFDHNIHPNLLQIIDPTLFTEGSYPNRLPINVVEQILDNHT